MFRLIITMLTLSLVVGCKQQSVSFSHVEGTPLNDGLGNDGGGNNNNAQPPVVRIVRSPADQILGEDNEVVFEVIVGTYPVSDVECFVDDQAVDCDPNGGVIEIVSPELGDHDVRIVVVDEEGLQGHTQDQWTVHNRYLRKVSNVTVEPGEKLSDILFVIDNSGSMADEQAGIADRINKFLEKLTDLNWRVAIITTDPSGYGSPYGAPATDGRMLAFPNGSYFISSELSLGEAKKQFSATITQGIDGSGNERGIYSVYRSIERALDPKEIIDGKHQEFFRENAALSVVIISDETETLNSISDGSELPDLFKSDGDNLVNFVKDSFGEDKIFQWNSIITRPGDRNCLTPSLGGLPGGTGTGYAYGVAYDDLSRKTGGSVGDICSADYSTELKAIGQEVASLQTTYDLSCVPQDLDKDGQVDFHVESLDGKTVPGYQLLGDKVKFNSPLKKGDYNFQYFCLNTI
ncbi:MAG: VWA domain-containing protein [Bdellovibrionales bacterium]|nr:VWA domain-containing protein [Bdellovibrionales bacterium]